ncbi:PqqD family protein [Thermodesulfobacteriota bacterium]
MFKPKQSGLLLTRPEAMNCIPVKPIQVDETRLESGEVLLAYPTYVRPWLAKLMRQLGGPADKVRTKKLQLDALGTAVWELLDGKRSVHQVVQQFAAKYSLHPKEAEVAVAQFLRELGRRGLVGLRQAE